MGNRLLEEFLIRAMAEDEGSGDHSSLASVPAGSTGNAVLIAKENGLLAGLSIVAVLFSLTDKTLVVTEFKNDGAPLMSGDKILELKGSVHSILRTERLALNILQRMSGIATVTAEYVEQVRGTGARILDTRKTTPGVRFLEKEAVRIGGGFNHRMGLYDMIMLKDNHIDYAGGIANAITRTRDYLNRCGLNLKIEIEARNLGEVEEIIRTGGVDRIMLDNFSVADTRLAVSLIGRKYETESSGGITLKTIRDYALCGVDYISVGALTHHIRSLDMSLKAFM